jgi:prepilin-type N-terminal cleavage/methylation domain-containing protein
VRRCGDDAGFTLVELLVAIAILGIIIVPLAETIIVGLRTTTGAQQRLTESRGVLISAAFFANDVQSADPTGLTVGSSARCGAGNAVVTMQWANDVSNSNIAAYVIATDPSGTLLLQRRFCQNGTLLNTVTVAPDLAAVPPTVTCSPGCGSPRTLTMTVTERTGYSYRVQGTRRST